MIDNLTFKECMKELGLKTKSEAYNFLYDNYIGFRFISDATIEAFTPDEDYTATGLSYLEAGLRCVLKEKIFDKIFPEQPPVTAFRDEFRFLSNFWYVPIEYEGVTYPTVEHAYQAAKTLDYTQREVILQAKSPGEARTLGQRVTLRPRWDEYKPQVMRKLLCQKYSKANPVLRNDLVVLTRGRHLTEGNHWHDNFFGSCTCAKCGNTGKNTLGKLLMEIRDYIEEERRFERFKKTQFK